MAESDSESGSSFIGNLEKFIIENWIGVLVVIAAFLLWKYGFVSTFIKEVLKLVGVFILGRFAWVMWLHYIQQDFISGIEWVVLEVIPPRDVLRSPKAMELFITNALYHWSNKGGREEFWQGAVWFWFSLEIVSIDGQVHFYIRTPSRIKSLIETQMYAQYPQSQVKEVEDYTLGVDEISEKSAWMGWGCEFGLLKPEAFPIKTYVDFGLDKDPKEEYKVDPISPVVELFGSIKKGEQLWLQIVVTPSKKTWKTEGTWFGKHDWTEESKKVLERLLLPYTSKRDEPGTNLVKLARVEVRVPDHLKNVVKRVNEKPNKLGFDTGIRLMYVAKKEVFDMSTRRNIRLIFRQYANPDSNGLNRMNSTQGDAYSGIFSASPETVKVLANRMLGNYRDRDFFHSPMRQILFSKDFIPWPLSGILKPHFVSQVFTLNTEELATLWHFPGQILKVPTLERIESKEAAPPTNLPI